MIFWPLTLALTPSLLPISCCHTDTGRQVWVAAPQLFHSWTHMLVINFTCLTRDEIPKSATCDWVGVCVCVCSRVQVLWRYNDVKCSSDAIAIDDGIPAVQHTNNKIIHSVISVRIAATFTQKCIWRTQWRSHSRSRVFSVEVF